MSSKPLKWNFNIPSGKPKIFGSFPEGKRITPRAQLGPYTPLARGYPQRGLGAQFRFNTQTPERMAEIQAKYKDQAHPDFIDRYADILNQPPKMMGWRGSVPSSEWYPEEHAAYIRDGKPKSKADIVRIMGTVGNPRHYGSGMATSFHGMPVPKKANIYKGRIS